MVETDRSDDEPRASARRAPAGTGRPHTRREPTSVATVELMDMVEAPFPDANRDPS